MLFLTIVIVNIIVINILSQYMDAFERMSKHKGYFCIEYCMPQCNALLTWLSIYRVIFEPYVISGVIFKICLTHYLIGLPKVKTFFFFLTEIWIKKPNNCIYLYDDNLMHLLTWTVSHVSVQKATGSYFILLLMLSAVLHINATREQPSSIFHDSSCMHMQMCSCL